ncbi:hypothetical protein BBO99_00002099 [Phytophthora kernoviae]|uniref:Uncharacterized protein n=1 Tax=Phytophthora kernoviae TaxID=325452 RepID=A0A3R7J3R1_9STRA|nr:hypothetical protein JM16_003958 [Phytophthora kernoviae]KAG2523046.1 hypothetical protein JM18_005399 [Phytophthora kernoviae]RLN14798.1 hypothetical protein BBI17_002053 [Phytophthora kernoviae]RLN83491.1 hypothetical protein BBO99_00002099 [Phytophthora kernoviae]
METTQTETVVENNVAVAAAGEGVDLTPTPTLTPRRRSLLPILPQQSVPLGSLVVDKEETRVAPLMSASKEIYFAKHKDLLKAGPVTNLVLHWNRCRLEYNVRRIARVWRHHRSTKHSNLSSANLLIEWLQKSVAVKSVGFRVFRGLRIYLRRVKRVQGLWRRKQAIRHLQFLIIEKAWVELETKYVDAAFEHQESMRLEVEQLGAQKKSPKSKPRKKRDLWMRFVPESFRSQVILEFLQKTEKEFTEKFRQQEIEFFPQLVQTLRGEHPNRARTFIRAVAKQHELCGQVVDTLLRYPGAVGEGVAIVKPFDTHGARVTRGAKEGSYVLFSETRLSSEEELVLTAIHERDLAEMIHDIPCKNKFVALELCQAQEPKEKRFDDAETIHHRIHEQFFSQVYKQIVKLRLRVLLDRGVRLPSNEEVTEEAVRTDSKLLNIILMESCDAKNEAPVRANDECVSNFLLRFRDAFRGAAVVSKLDEDEPNERRSLLAKELLKYVSSSVREDATKHNASVYAEYKGQMRTRYEHAAEFQDITHTPGVLGADHAIDFGLGEIPVQMLSFLLCSGTTSSVAVMVQLVQMENGKQVSGREQQPFKY